MCLSSLKAGSTPVSAAKLFINKLNMEEVKRKRKLKKPPIWTAKPGEDANITTYNEPKKEAIFVSPKCTNFSPENIQRNS